MKRFFCLFIVLSLFPFFAFAEYEPKLDMTLQEFLDKYNSISTGIGSPLVSLEAPVKWGKNDGRNVA